MKQRAKPGRMAGNSCLPRFERAARSFSSKLTACFPGDDGESRIESHYPKRGKGRRRIRCACCCACNLVRQWFAPSDRAAQDAATDSVAIREFWGWG